MKSEKFFFFLVLNSYVIHSVHIHGEPTPGLGLLPNLGVMEVPFELMSPRLG